ncbi:MAG TPA: flagellar protein FlgN [Roseiarcus sp.]|nr:flagellar protein FlgN [Roseiarcus sp.]
MSQPPRRTQSPAAAAALPIVQRLVATIDAENHDLEQGRRVKYEAYSQSKNQGLLELNRLVPALGGVTAAGPLRDALAELHVKLEINRRTLAVQLKACHAVSEIIARAIQDGQSDGTYTALAWRRPRE